MLIYKKPEMSHKFNRTQFTCRTVSVHTARTYRDTRWVYITIFVESNFLMQPFHSYFIDAR